MPSAVFGLVLLPKFLGSFLVSGFVKSAWFGWLVVVVLVSPFGFVVLAGIISGAL